MEKITLKDITDEMTKEETIDVMTRNLRKLIDYTDYIQRHFKHYQLPSFSDVMAVACKQLAAQGKECDMESITETYLSVKYLFYKNIGDKNA